MKQRIYKGECIFEIDPNGDNYESFNKVVEYLIRLNVHVVDYYPGFFDFSYFKFEYLGIIFNLEYSGFSGTELKMSDTIEINDNSVFDNFLNDINNIVNSV